MKTRKRKQEAEVDDGSSIPERSIKREKPEAVDPIISPDARLVLVWISVSRQMPLPKDTVIFTNLIKGTVNDGCMSHLWSGRLKRSDAYTSCAEVNVVGQSYDYLWGVWNQSYNVRDVTHWAPMPPGWNGNKLRQHLRLVHFEPTGEMGAILLPDTQDTPCTLMPKTSFKFVLQKTVDT